MKSFAGSHTWPPLEFRTLGSTGFHDVSGARLAKEIIAALASSALRLSARGFVLIYLAFACLPVEIGLSALLWQQLYYIYEGRTYINRINSLNAWRGEKGLQDLLRFFGCPYSVFRVLLGPASAGKLQDTSSSKLL
nr:DHHC zinc finger domain-containing protein [Elaeis guineensis]